ncbi:MAG: DUF4443 domain-containing protein [Candidatus Bathyarchaeia archaeon]
METNELLRKIAAVKAPGPLPLFTPFDVMKAIELIGSRGPIGRPKLSKLLGLGEGSTKELLRRIKKAGIVGTSPRGCTLTSKGRAFWQELVAKIGRAMRIQAGPLTVGQIDVAILVKNAGHKVTTGIQQRDAAIKIGGDGATTIVYRNGRLIAPQISGDVVRDYPDVADRLRSAFPIEENSVIIIGTASSEEKAERAARAAVDTLMGEQL